MNASLIDVGPGQRGIPSFTLKIVWTPHGPAHYISYHQVPVKWHVHHFQY